MQEGCAGAQAVKTAVLAEAVDAVVARMRVGDLKDTALHMLGAQHKWPQEGRGGSQVA